MKEVLFLSVSLSLFFLSTLLLQSVGLGHYRFGFDLQLLLINLFLFFIEV